jgi:pescadillo protein
MRGVGWGHTHSVVRGRSCRAGGIYLTLSRLSRVAGEDWERGTVCDAQSSHQEAPASTVRVQEAVYLEGYAFERADRAVIRKLERCVERLLRVPPSPRSHPSSRALPTVAGIHPRDPKKKTQGHHKTYYHVKDIAFLLHEPMLAKIREIAAHEKKIKRAMAKKNPSLAKRIAARRPDYRLDHLVKERYPSLMDALRDLDDALAMIHLFAVLPADQVLGVEVAKVQLSRRLALEWQAYVVCSHTLRKSFVSVKGFYYQAEVKGQALTWMVPHQVSQILPPDVDFKVMTTFLEFYQSTLQFVLFSLYAEMGIQYPPNVDDAVDEAGILSIGNTAQMIEEVRKGEAGGAAVKEIQKKIEDLEKEIQGMEGRDAKDEDGDGDGEDLPELDEGSSSTEEEEEEEEEGDADEGSDGASDPEDEDIPVHRVAMPDGAGGDADADADGDAEPSTASALVGGAVDVADEESICSTLFSGMKFFVGREVPREQLSLVIQSFGGVVGWDGAGSPYEESDARITHQIIDRPKPLIEHENRLFVQPQWVFDSTNARVLVDASRYAPGLVPPPHLSPFVQPEEDDHVPEYAKEIQELKDAAHRARLKAAGEAVEDEFLGRKDGREDDDSRKEASLADLEQQHAEELAKELGGDKGTDKGKDDKRTSSKSTKRTKKGEEEPADDEAAMASHLMTRKVKRAYQKAMQEKVAKRAKTARLGNKAIQAKAALASKAK